MQFLEIPCLSPRIVCTSKIGNLSMQVGVPPGVGFGLRDFVFLGGGSEGVCVVRLANHLRDIPRCEEG